MIKKVQLHRKKGYTESSLNKCIVWQSFHFHYFFTKFVLFHSLKKQIKMLMITKKNEHNQNKAFSLSQELLSQLLNAFFVVVVVVVAFACFDQSAICYVVYHFLTNDLKSRFKLKQKIQKQSRNSGKSVIVWLVATIVTTYNFFGEVFSKTILPNS